MAQRWARVFCVGLKINECKSFENRKSSGQIHQSWKTKGIKCNQTDRNLFICHTVYLLHNIDFILFHYYFSLCTMFTLVMKVFKNFKKLKVFLCFFFNLWNSYHKYWVMRRPLLYQTHPTSLKPRTFPEFHTQTV